MGLARNLEDVSIEAVHVGDYVWLPWEPAMEVACVLAKSSIRIKARRAGWQLELAHGRAVWLPRSARVKRAATGW